MNKEQVLKEVKQAVDKALKEQIITMGIGHEENSFKSVSKISHKDNPSHTEYYIFYDTKHQLLLLTCDLIIERTSLGAWKTSVNIEKFRVKPLTSKQLKKINKEKQDGSSIQRADDYTVE